MRSVPGPWLNSITEIPAFLALVSGNQHTYYKSLHETYGPVVRVSPNELSFVSLEAREEIYGLRVRLSPRFIQFLSRGAELSLIHLYRKAD